MGVTHICHKNTVITLLCVVSLLFSVGAIDLRGLQRPLVQSLGRGGTGGRPLLFSGGS